MSQKDTYLTIASRSEGLFKDNGSRFIALAYPVQTEQEVKEIVSSLRKEYYDARHHCYAYRLGYDGAVWRASDDGEPSGTAGRPILGQIDSLQLCDVLVVVVRYFGGIKLGVPGLIRAYKSSTADALASAEIVERIAGHWYRLDFPYENLPAVMKVLKDMDLQQRNQSFLNDCSLEVFIRLTLEDNLIQRIEKICKFERII
ncbi:MAG: YigZ family protein [Bacteroidales bacterium]|nr:YigZ family protein [Bacteroidales bacterium]MBQ2006436.1 YigZ family protein [Bacteroidales bacterium]MBQ5581739.1 YigZ family protein [Bacteroidales bacterium]